MRAILSVVLLAACRNPEAEPKALDYVAVCSPGRSFVKCHDALQKDRVAAIPAVPIDDLISISVEGVSLMNGRAPTFPSSQGAFRYTMVFREGYGTVRARVANILEDQLGQPTTITGSPPIADPGAPGGDYWVAADGIWILNNTTVTWYSQPIHGLTSNDLFPWDDKHIRPAPSSAPLWRHVGRVLATY